MFSVGEIVVLCVAAAWVFGPNELPRVARHAGAPLACFARQRPGLRACLRVVALATDGLPCSSMWAVTAAVPPQPAAAAPPPFHPRPGRRCSHPPPRRPADGAGNGLPVPRQGQVLQVCGRHGSDKGAQDLSLFEKRREGRLRLAWLSMRTCRCSLGAAACRVQHALACWVGCGRACRACSAEVGAAFAGCEPAAAGHAGGHHYAAPFTAPVQLCSGTRSWRLLLTDLAPSPWPPSPAAQLHEEMQATMYQLNAIRAELQGGINLFNPGCADSSFVINLIDSCP